MIVERLGYLVEPNNQFVLPNGATNVAGIVRVYYAETDDLAKTYCNFEGTRNPADIRLDNNGRAIIIADATKAYRVEVRDPNGGLLWTVEPAYCIGGEGGGTPVAVSVPLVRVKFQNGTLTKISGDDDFVKDNEFGIKSFYLPEIGWYQFDITLSMKNNTPRDMIQHLQLKWAWCVFIEEGVPPATINEPNLPSITHEADYTTEWTNNRSASSLYHKDGLTMNWLGVELTAYGDSLPNDVEYAVFVEVFKVRDA